MGSTTKRTVLITGCSGGGIGHALAKEYNNKGLRVFATARRLDSMVELRNIGIETLELDVSSVESIKRTANQVSILAGGRLDVLVNNASHLTCTFEAYTLPATDISLTEVKALFDVNVFGVMAMVQEFVHLLINSGDARIVNIGSVAGVMPYVFGSAYNASKAALHSYGDTLRVELAPFNVKVITIITGGVKTTASPPRSLPADSIYQPMRHEFETLRVGNSQKTGMLVEEYARSVVLESLKTTPSAWFWKGTSSFTVWFVDTFLLKKAFDSPISRKFKLAAVLRKGQPSHTTNI
ncbi:hypothetical protein BOTBODRAFT_54565 [Botryobasidium botryosum FD-172 SS1]|uniref:NAD(P)-binding protein n=1 Tax=Botryobasidium botryosum (strain FD-172 SS1) TaxID=930990 RepID=A0A067MVT8_BOTB1|nr:hypothetical protein BOTBODRAFT_54565 [Botryobasidium botryosum FD-172 SS1]